VTSFGNGRGRYLFSTVNFEASSFQTWWSYKLAFEVLAIIIVIKQIIIIFMIGLLKYGMFIMDIFA
jgi:hypothetical protein